MPEGSASPCSRYLSKHTQADASASGTRARKGWLCSNLRLERQSKDVPMSSYMQSARNISCSQSHNFVTPSPPACHVAQSCQDTLGTNFILRARAGSLSDEWVVPVDPIAARRSKHWPIYAIGCDQRNIMHLQMGASPIYGFETFLAFSPCPGDRRQQPWKVPEYLLLIPPATSMVGTYLLLPR